MSQPHGPSLRPAALASAGALAALLLAPGSAGQSLLTTFHGTTLDGQYGKAVAYAGDVDGDGVEDVLVGSPDFDGGRGRAEVRSGRDGTLFVGFLGGPGDRVGQAVTNAGDMNNDGFCEFAYSSTGDSTPSGGQTWYDPVHIWDEQHDVFLHTLWQLTDDDTGWSLSGGGDSNADGLPELLVGAPGFDTNGGLVDAGRVIRFRFFSTGTSTAVVATGDQAGQKLGWSVAWVGNVDGAGSDDFAVGSPFRDEIGLPGAADVGRVHVYSGVGLALWTQKGPVQEGGRFGWTLGGGQDLTGDGLPDVLVGAPHYGNDRGRLVLYRGHDGVTHASRLGDDDGDRFGASVATVRFDGAWQVLAGAPGDGETSGFTLLNPGVVHRLETAALSTVWSQKGGASYGELGSSLARVGDNNADGSDEWAAGQPFPAVVVTDEEGAVQLWDGQTHVAAWEPVGSGLAGSHGVPVLVPNTVPALGASVQIFMTNALLASTTSVLFVGLDGIAVPFKGGTLHVEPLLAFVLPLGPQGWQIPLVVPVDFTLAGFDLWLQGAHLDPGAPAGVALTAGLVLHYGV